MATADKLAARLIKTKYELPISADANLGGILESLVCKLAGFPDCKIFKEMAARLLGREVNHTLPAENVLKLARGCCSASARSRSVSTITA